jgi:hypothetical protein
LIVKESPQFILAVIIATLGSATPGRASGQLELVTNAEAQCVFAGEARNIAVVFHNAAGGNFREDMSARIYQTSSATAVLLAETPWKRLEIPAGETVLESAALDFPAVRSGTKFVIEWLEGTNHAVGKSEVLVYPTNLLGELKPLLKENVPGVYDPDNRLKPLLRQNHVDFEDLSETPLEAFRGRLAIVGPFASKEQMPDGLASQIKSLARAGAGVVWLRPPPGPQEKIAPSFYLVPEGAGTVVVVQAVLTSALRENPQSQLNLVYFCRLALNPQGPVLPDLSPQP